MTKVITQLEANRFYGSLLAVHDKTRDLKPNASILNIPLYVHRLKEIQPIFEAVINEATKNLQGASMFNRLNILIDEQKFTKDFVDYLHATRIDCNHARHYDQNHAVMKEEQNYYRCFQTTAILIFRLSGIAIFDSVKAVFGESNNFLPIEAKPKYVKPQPTKKELSIEEKEIQDYPNERLPIVILLDESGSMGYDIKRIDDINKGIQLLGRSLFENEHTRNLVELSVITFGHEVKEILKFTRLEKQIEQLQNIKIEAVGNETRIGEALNHALETLDKRKALIKENGGSYWQPWLFIISDSDGRYIDDYKDAAKKACELETEKKPKLTIFPVLVGDADWNILKEFSNKRDPFKLSESDFELFFYWIFKEAKYVSMSQGIEHARNIDLKKVNNEFKEIRR